MSGEPTIKDLKREIANLKAIGSLLVDSDDEAKMANHLYRLQTENAALKEALAELERSEKLLQEYREVIRELLPIAQKARGLEFPNEQFPKAIQAIEKAKSLLHQPNRAI